MNGTKATTAVAVGCAVLLGVSGASGQDWPGWLGPHRDAHATGFKPPKAWPKELTKKWSVKVGDGVATPALVGERLYVFSRQDGNEVIRCLKAANGEEVWQDKYEAAAPGRPAGGFNGEFVGPRASPVVADGKVVVFGVGGALSCYDAAGKKLWRKDDIKGRPRFFTSSSPLVADGLVVAQLGGRGDGAVAAYELGSGKEKWKWSGDEPGYASPVLAQLGKEKLVVAETATRIVGLNLADGKLLWETPYAVTGRGYNASTPLVDGQTLLYAGSGRGTKAMKLEKKDGKVVGTPLWSNNNNVAFNTPVLDNGLVYGLSDRNALFCINAKDGTTAWTAPLTGAGAGGGGGGGRGRGRGMAGYGSIVAAGAYLLALTPQGDLVVFDASAKGYKKVASYKVAAKDTFAYPVVSGNRVFVKDRESLTQWSIE
jgi:outer membrane protein assembly factor BamB